MKSPGLQRFENHAMKSCQVEVLVVGLVPYITCLLSLAQRKVKPQYIPPNTELSNF